MEFFALKRPGPRETDADTQFTPSEQAHYGEAEHCSHCRGATSLKCWLHPYEVEMEFWTTKYGDIAYFLDDLLVSERFRTLYFDSGITGLKLLGQVDILKVSPINMTKGIPTYFVARVSRDGAVFDHTASEGENDGEVCPVCRLSPDLLRYHRVCLEKGSWNGSDVFHATGLPGEILVSSKFKAFCEYNRISNTLFVPISECSYDSGVHL